MMTPARTYEGRELPRPDDEVVDQGLGFDVGTLLNRRSLLAAAGSTGLLAGLAACGTGAAATSATSDSSSTAAAGSAGALTEIPDETAGPYPGDGSNGPDVLEQSGIVRSDLRSSFGGATGTAEGVPMTLELTILDMAKENAPFAGVAVYVWHCDRDGNYSMYTAGVENENYLRGVQVSDDTGLVRFTSIMPACYSGRWPHIHFEVYPDQASITDATTALATSQVAIPEGICATVFSQTGYEQSVANLARVSLSSDNVFGDDGAVTQLATVTGDTTAGFTVRLTVPVDTRTAPTGGAAPGGGGGAPSGGPGGTPPSGGPNR